MEILEAIANRRSIRHYLTDPVDDKTLNAVLEAARWAPSWGNTQCCRFIVVRDSRLKAALADTLFKMKRRDGTPGDNPALQALSQAPVVIVVCAELGKSGGQHGGGPMTDKGDYWFMFDSALTIQNLALAAHALGLGTVIIGAFDAVKAAAVLQVPAGHVVVAMTPLGYPDPTRPAKAPPRKDLTETVFYDKFGK